MCERADDSTHAAFKNLTLPMIRRRIHVFCPTIPSPLPGFLLMMGCIFCGEGVTRGQVVHGYLNALSVLIVHCGPI